MPSAPGWRSCFNRDTPFSSRHSRPLNVARQMSGCLCRQACPASRPFAGLIAQKTGGRTAGAVSGMEET